MKVDKKNAKGCNVDLIVKAEAAEIKDAYGRVIKEFVREARIPGFRPGKAPLAVIKKTYAAEIERESQTACFRAIYPQAAKESGLEIVEIAEVKDAKLDPETGFEFTATVEIKPEFKLPKYKKLGIDFKEVSVSDDDVNQRVESMRKAYSKYEDAKEGAVIAEGDFVQMDFKGTIDDKPVAEFDKDAARISEATGFWTMVEEDRFVPEVTEALKGMKAGESKEVKVKFAKENVPAGIAGKKAVYNITVKAFRSRIIPDDAAFVEAVKGESIEKIRENMKNDMVKQATDAEEARRREAALDLLLKKADFDVPASQVRAETQNYLQRLAERAQYSGLTAEYFEKNREQILKDAEESATKQVRLSYILAEIAKEEKIEVTDADADKRIAEIAKQAGKTDAEVKQAIESNGNMPALKAQLVAEKTIDLILAEAK